MVLKLIDKVKFLLRILSCVTVCTLTIIIGIQVVNRYVFGTSFTWVEELAGMAMVYITYFGAAMATINNSNTRIDFLSASSAMRQSWWAPISMPFQQL